MKNKIKEITDILIKTKYLRISLAAFILIEGLFLYFTNLDLMFGNFGMAHTYSFLFLDLFNAILFASYLPLLIYIKNISNKICKTGSTTGFLGTASTAIVSGCPSCGITLAAYLGFASTLSVLPFYGFELKILGSILLIFSLVSLSRKL